MRHMCSWLKTLSCRTFVNGHSLVELTSVFAVDERTLCFCFCFSMAESTNVVENLQMDPRDDGSGSVVPYGMLTRLLRRMDHLEFNLLRGQQSELEDFSRTMQETRSTLGHIQKARRAGEDMAEIGLAPGPDKPPADGITDVPANAVSTVVAAMGEVMPQHPALPKPSAPPMPMGHRGPGVVPAGKPKLSMQIDTPEAREKQGPTSGAKQRAQSTPPVWSWAGPLQVTASAKEKRRSFPW